MLTADQPWDSSTISDYLDGQVVYPDTKGIGGESCAQLYVGKKSLYTKVYGMSSESQGHDTLEFFIADVGGQSSSHFSWGFPTVSVLRHDVHDPYPQH